MKKLLLLTAICLYAISAQAQLSKESADFKAYCMKADSASLAAAGQKQYPQAVKILNDWLEQYDNLSPETKQNVRGLTESLYYNLTCCLALDGKKDKAIAAFKQAADEGYSNYAHVLEDSDLNSLRDDATFKAILLKMRGKSDYNYLLKQAGPYNKGQDGLPVFAYQTANAPELVNFRRQFNLDSVAGRGDEISKIKSLLYWAHNVVRHDGGAGNPPSKNAIDLIAVCRKDDRGVNCRMMATILKDAYQAEGFKSRLVTCMPKDTNDFDCHVITVVWSKTLNKWVWMDPTFNAFVSDDKGNLLNIEEVRERLLTDKPLVLNEDANWNNKMKETKAEYLGRYMSKNLYWLKCAVKSDWDLETRKSGMSAIEYVDLYPGGFSTISGKPKKTEQGQVEYATNDPAYFWQKPAGE